MKRLTLKSCWLILLPLTVASGCSTTTYESSEWSSDGELRQQEVNKLVTRSGEHSAGGRNPMKDSLMLRSDSVSPLDADTVAEELQQIAEELSQDWRGEPCYCQVRVGPRFSFGGFTYPNGTIVIQAGTLEFLDTRDEVAALLAHELSHLWLDHHQKNQLQSTAKDASDLIQAISIFGNDDNAREATLRIGGSTDALVAAAGFTQWNREQETEADLLAAKILEASRYSPMAMIALLTKLKNGSDEIPVAGSVYEEMASVTAMNLREEGEVSDSQIQKWLSSIASDMGGREYLSSEERRQIVRLVIYDLESASLARSFSDMDIDRQVLSPVTGLKSLPAYRPGQPEYAELVDRALTYEPDNLHLQVMKFRDVVARNEQQQAARMARAFVERPDATFSALSEATQYLDQSAVVSEEERKALMRAALMKLVELDLPDAYVADQYYLSERYDVPLLNEVNEKLCEANIGKATVRQRCELATRALEGNQSFYQLLASAEQ